LASRAAQRRRLLRQALHEETLITQHIREGRFQRSLAVVAALASLMSGGEVAYEHYRGSYGQQIMYTPIILSAGLTATGVAAAFNRLIARRLLPLISLLVLVDGVVGFIFHVRGIARKPGGWRVPVNNMIMGPPVFAPLLFGLSGYLGLIASFLRRENDPAALEPIADRVPDIGLRQGRGLRAALPRLTREGLIFEHHVREGRFQRNIAAVAGISAFFSGCEAAYSHYQNGFQYRWLQSSPLLIAPLLTLTGIGSIWSRRLATTLLPVISALALSDGAMGTFFHARGVLRKPGGLRLPLYNLIYGPPLFAPMLLSASGFLGLLAALLRRPAHT